MKRNLLFTLGLVALVLIGTVVALFVLVAAIISALFSGVDKLVESVVTKYAIWQAFVQAATNEVVTNRMENAPTTKLGKTREWLTIRLIAAHILYISVKSLCISSFNNWKEKRRKAKAERPVNVEATVCEGGAA